MMTRRTVGLVLLGAGACLLAGSVSRAASTPPGTSPSTPLRASQEQAPNRREFTISARDYALTRIFSNQSGTYSTGLDDATLASDSWEDEGRLAELYLARTQYAYGPDESRWGRKPDGLNLYAEQLEGAEAAVLARSSNLYGTLTTDDPFQYLGGIGLAVRHLNGTSPSLYISNLRDPARGKVESAARFLAGELRARDAETLAGFYRHLLGLEETRRTAGVIALGVAWYINKMPSPFGTRMPTAKSDSKAAPAQTARMEDRTATTETKPRFDFYKMLPAEPAPEPQAREPEKRKSTPTAREAFFLQAGAFQNAADADGLKARLALLGIEATIQTTTLPDKGVWHRVRVGPINSVPQVHRAEAVIGELAHRCALLDRVLGAQVFAATDKPARDRMVRLRHAPAIDYVARLKDGGVERFGERMPERANTFAKALAREGAALAFTLSFRSAMAQMAASVVAAPAMSHFISHIPDEGLRLMGDAAQRALALDAESPEAHSRLAAFYFYTGADERAFTHRDLAEKYGAGSPLVLSQQAGQLKWIGRIEEAIEMQQRAIELDPLSKVLHGNLASAFLLAGRLSEARQSALTALGIDSGRPGDPAHSALIIAHVLEGTAGQALPWLEGWPEGPQRDVYAALVHDALGDRAPKYDRVAVPAVGHEVVLGDLVRRCCGQVDRCARAAPVWSLPDGTRDTTSHGLLDVEREAEAGDLGEAPVRARHRADPVLQVGLELRAGHRQRGGDVREGQDGEHLAPRDQPRRRREARAEPIAAAGRRAREAVPQAARVRDRELGAVGGPHRVRRRVADPGLAEAAVGPDVGASGVLQFSFFGHDLFLREG